MADINKSLTENKTERIIIPENNPEHISVPEKQIENNEEIRKEKEAVLNEIEKYNNNASSNAGNASIVHQDEENKIKKRIEAVMEEELEEIYLKMPPDKQKEFRISGERTANEIFRLLKEVKINIKKIVNLIVKWLLTIPGINKYYAEQEAKIKTDEILRIKESTLKF